MFPGPTNYGIDIFFKKHTSLIDNKNVGVLAINSSVNKKGEHIIDLLKKENSTNLIRIFSPEHGFYSDISAGDKKGMHKLRRDFHNEIMKTIFG